MTPLERAIAERAAYDDLACGRIAVERNCPEGGAENTRLAPLIQALTKVSVCADTLDMHMVEFSDEPDCWVESAQHLHDALHDLRALLGIKGEE